jgi:hypothetical protein
MSLSKNKPYKHTVEVRDDDDRRHETNRVRWVVIIHVAVISWFLGHSKKQKQRSKNNEGSLFGKVLSTVTVSDIRFV